MKTLLLVAMLLAFGSACDGDTPAASEDSETPRATAIPSATPFAIPASVPSGALIFRATGNSEIDVMRVNADGTGLAVLAGEDGPERPGGWSPDGSEIAYTRAPTPYTPSDIYVVSGEGKQARNVTATTADDETFVAWSPDGEAILFAKYGYYDAEYWVMARDGTGRARIVTRCQCFEPQWMPDGETLLAALPVGESQPTGRPRLAIIDREGTIVRDVASSVDALNQARLSPDGTRVAYGTSDGVVVMAVATAETSRVWEGPSPHQIEWSSDGENLAFLARSLTPAAPGVASPPVDTTDLHVLPLGTGQSSILVTQRELSGIAWSPDAARIAYQASMSDGYAVYVMPSGGGSAIRVSGSGLSGATPRWSPDGTSLIFATNMRSRDGIDWYDPQTGAFGVIDRDYNQLLDEDVILMLTGGCATVPSATDQRITCESPSGDRRAEVVPCDANSPQPCALQMIDESTGATLARTPPGLSVFPSAPSWSPDGTAVAFRATSEEGAGVYTLSAAGELRRLAPIDGLPFAEPGLAWSTRDEIFFTRGTFCGEGCAPGFLHRIRADGTRDEQVLDLRVAEMYGFAP